MFSDFLVRTRMTTHLYNIKRQCVFEMNIHAKLPILCQACGSSRSKSTSADFAKTFCVWNASPREDGPDRARNCFKLILNIECIWMLKKLEIPSTYNSLRSNSICVNKRFERNFFKTCCYIQFVLFVAFPAFILKCQPSNRRASWSPKPSHHDYHTNRTRRSRQLSLRIPRCWWHALATSELRKMVQPWKHIH